MRQQAEKWGITTTSHQRLQPLVVARAATEYERHFNAAVDAAWHAACAAAKPDDQPTTEQPEQAKEAEPPMAEQPEPTKADDSAKEAEPTCSDSSGVGGKRAKAKEAGAKGKASKAGKKKPTTTCQVRAISHDPPLSTKPAWQPTAKPIAEPAAKPIAEPADKPKGRTGGEAASSSGTRTSPRLSARNPPAQAPPAAGQPQPAGRPAWHPPDVVRMVTISADPPEPSENPPVAVEDESEDSNDRRRAARIQSQLKLSFKGAYTRPSMNR